MRHRRYAALGAALLLAAAGAAGACADRGTRPATEASAQAAVTSSALPLAQVASEPETWSVDFERSIGWSSSVPVFAPDGSEVVSGGARFDRDGRFLGHASVHVPGGRMVATVRALLPGGLALVVGHEHEGQRLIVVGALDEPPEQAPHRVQSGEVLAVAVSRAGDRVATIEDGAVVVRSLPALRPLDRLALPDEDGSYHPRAIAFAGEAVAFTRRAAACADPCQEAALLTWDEGKTRVVREGGLRRVAFSPSGESAALLRADGEIETIATASGERLGAFAAGEGYLDLEVADAGAAVAVGACGRLRVFARAGQRYRAVFDETLPGDTSHCPGFAMRFAADGRLAAVSQHLTVLHGGAPAPVPDVAYRPEPPDGFEATADNRLWNTVDATGWAPAPRRLAGWFHDGDTAIAEVRAVVRDASQLAGRDSLETWSEAVLLRLEPRLAGEVARNRLAADADRQLAYRAAYIDAAGRRTLEYAIFVRGGCEPSDVYVRMVEAGDALLELRLETFPGTDPDLVRTWFAAFFDAPFEGDAPAPRLVSNPLERAGGC